MSDIIERLLLRNLQEVFGQGDPMRRRGAIDELYTKDCTVHRNCPGSPRLNRV